jgi:8-oxo-dGTP pyrophosphatase MutT (NUDIX family)
MSRPFAIVLAFEDSERERFVLARHEERGWEIPGGHLEEGESPAEAARREFAEEIGHALEALSPVLVQEREVGTCHVFAARVGPRTREGDTHDDRIVDWRFVERLGDVEPLAFPDDPYAEIEEELGVELT